MDCIFCAIAAGTAPGHVLLPGDRVLVILSLEGHPLVMPRAHVPRLAALDEATGAAIMRAALRVAAALPAATGCEGVNLVLSDGVAAGQDVPHLHLHVKPRWVGDGALLRWDTAALPEGERERMADAIRRGLDPAG